MKKTVLALSVAGALATLYGCTGNGTDPAATIGAAADIAVTVTTIADARAEIRAVIAQVDAVAAQWPEADRAAWGEVTVGANALLERLEWMRGAGAVPPLADMDTTLHHAEYLYQRGRDLVRPHLAEFGADGQARLRVFAQAHDHMLMVYEAYRQNQTAHAATAALDAVVKLAAVAVKLGALL